MAAAGAPVRRCWAAGVTGVALAGGRRRWTAPRVAGAPPRQRWRVVRGARVHSAKDGRLCVALLLLLRAAVGSVSPWRGSRRQGASPRPPPPPAAGRLSLCACDRRRRGGERSSRAGAGASRPRLADGAGPPRSPQRGRRTPEPDRGCGCSSAERRPCRRSRDA